MHTTTTEYALLPSANNVIRRQCHEALSYITSCSTTMPEADKAFQFAFGYVFAKQNALHYDAALSDDIAAILHNCMLTYYPNQ